MSAKYTRSKRRTYRDLELEVELTESPAPVSKNVVKELKEKRQNKSNKLKSLLTSFFKK